MVVKGSCHARVQGHYVTLRGRSRYGRGGQGTYLGLDLGLAVPIAGEHNRAYLSTYQPCQPLSLVDKIDQPTRSGLVWLGL